MQPKNVAGAMRKGLCWTRSTNTRNKEVCVAGVADVDTVVNLKGSRKLVTSWTESGFLFDLGGEIKMVRKVE